jgi:hypothetical protein
MGQKTNAISFRINTKNPEWNSRYMEKNTEEYFFFIHLNLEIEKFLNYLFKLYGIILHNYKIYFTDTNLIIYISYFITLKTVFLINKIKKNQKFLLGKKKLRIKKTKNRLKIIKNFKKYLLNSRFKYKTILKKNNFTELLLESLNIFTKNKFNIFINLQNLNKSLCLNLKMYDKTLLKNLILQLRSFYRKPFFIETINIILVTLKKKKSARLLAEYIAVQLNKKTRGVFLTFLRKAIAFFIKSKISTVKGLKFVIKGRLGNSPRTKTKIIQIGNIPLQTINKKIDYFQTTSYTSNGTIGTKVWICEN